MSDQTWFFAFWGVFFLLGFIEWWSSGTRYSYLPVSNLDRLNRWPVNIGIGIINGLLFSLIPVSAVLMASWAAANNFGLMNIVEAPLLVLIIVTILARNLGQYAFHRLVHRIPWLWAVHRVHHCDTHMDGSTALRFHPLELIANIVFIAPLVVLLGLDPVTLIAFESFDILFGIISHISIKLPKAFEKLMQTILITPGLHRLHHSEFEPETESNFGTVFSFWDRLFGTFLAEPLRPQEGFLFGIEGIDRKKAIDFGWLIISPWQKINSVKSASKKLQQVSSNSERNRQ